MVKDNLGLIFLNEMDDFGKKVDLSLQETRHKNTSYIIPTEFVRFNNGEGKVIIQDSVRNKDIYILADIGNHSCTYKMFGYENHMGPDEHFQDIKRVISAIGGQADKITIVSPLLYASRQHRYKEHESSDCTMALQELERIGANCIVTFDLHDSNIFNSVNLMAKENINPTNVVLENLLKNERVVPRDTIVISPDKGAMERAKRIANVLSTNVGVFAKVRDLTKIVNGKNPIISHEYMGCSVKNKDIIVVDDMIASGESMIDAAKELKKREANDIFLMATFSLFTNGISKFKDAYNSKYFNKLYTTNLSYVNPSAKYESWFRISDCSSYLATIINKMHNKESISSIVDDNDKVLSLVNEKNKCK